MVERRSFLSATVAAAVAAPFVGVQQGSTAPPSGRKIRVGALNVGEYSFWGIWAETLSPQGKFGTNLLDMEITHCWDINPKLAQKFANRYECEVVEKYDGMLGKVDAIAFGGFYEVPWQHLLARPYVEAGVPTYLSRPFSYRLVDIEFILELAAKHGTPLMASSCQEHIYGLTDLKKRLKNCGTITAVQGTCVSDEYPAHFHLQWAALRTLGYDVEKISLLTDDERKASYLQETMLFRGGEGQPPYLATLNAVNSRPYLYLKVMGDQGSETSSFDRSPDPQEELYFYFAPQLLDMQRTFQGDSFQPLDIIRKKTQTFLAGYYSHLEHRGALVPVNSVPMDWSPRYYKPRWIDESIFKS